MNALNTRIASQAILVRVGPVVRTGYRVDRTNRQTKVCRRTTFVWTVALVLSAAGCQQHDSLYGTVTYNGEPVEKGSILFMSADGYGSGFGAQVRDGSYSTEQVKLGKHVAIVRGLEKPAVISKDESIQQRQQNDNPHGLNVDYIPEDADGNSRTVDVEGGEQALDFALEGPPRSE